MVRTKGQGREGDGDTWYTRMEEATAALSRARQGRDLASEAEACHDLAFLHSLAGNHRDAAEMARACLRTRRRLDEPLAIARALAGMGALAGGRGSLQESEPWLRRTLAAYCRVASVEERCMAAVAFAQVLASMGRTGEAHAVVAGSLDLCTDDSLAWCRWSLLEVDAEAFLHERRPEAALACMEAAFHERQRQDAVGSTGLRLLAQVYQEAGCPWEAKEMYRMAFEQACSEGDGQEMDLARNGSCQVSSPHSAATVRKAPTGMKLGAWVRPN